VRRVLCVLGACGGLAGLCRGDVLAVNPSKDNTLYQDSEGQLSNGIGPGIFSGNTAGGLTRRAVLAFDLSSIPAGSIVTAATLRLTMTKTTAGTMTHTLHRVLADWGEGVSNSGASGGAGWTAAPGDATWIHRFYGTPGAEWAAAGGDFLPAASASQQIGGNGNYTFSGAGLIADVQHWIDHPGQSFGWLVKGNEAQFHTAKRFASREYPTSSSRPLLTVTYTIPAPGAGPVLGAGLLAARRRRR
jgi:uncharacterized protein (TIGR03382 family)